jgi:hypothetical protein
MGQEVYGNFGNRWFDAAPARESTTDITVYKSSWDSQAWERLRLRLPLRLRVLGPEAAAFRETFQSDARGPLPWTGITQIDRTLAAAARSRRSAGGDAQRVAVSDRDLIAAIVAARLLGVASLLVILALCLHAIDCGYQVEIEFKDKVPLPWEQELLFHLTPK